MPHSSTQPATCFCNICRNEIGKLWTQIGKPYFSPIIESDGNLGIICQPFIREGENGTVVEICPKEYVDCAKCSAFLGNKFPHTPICHIDEDQILFWPDSVTVSDDAGEQVNLAIKRVLNYKEPARVSTVNSAETEGESGTPHRSEVIDISLPKNELASQRAHINQIDSNSPRVANALEKRADGARDYLAKLETTVEKCLLEIKGTLDDLASIKIEVNDPKDVQYQQATSLDQRLDSVSAELSQTRNEVTKSTNQVQQELTDLRSQVSDLQNQVDILTSKANNSVSATNDGNEVATLRAENADLRRLLSNMRSNNNPERSFPSKELDILTSNIAKIGNRASQVESLQMEFEILKGRVERLEAGRQITERQEPTRLFGAGDLSPNINMSPTYRKRTSSEAGLRETDLAKKLPVVSARPSLSTRIPQLSTRRRFILREAAEPEGALPQRGRGPQSSLSETSSKDREPGRGEKN